MFSREIESVRSKLNSQHPVQLLDIEIPIVRAWAQVKETREVVRRIILPRDVAELDVEGRVGERRLQLLDGERLMSKEREAKPRFMVCIAAELSVPRRILVRAPSG